MQSCSYYLIFVLTMSLLSSFVYAEQSVHTDSSSIQLETSRIRFPPQAFPFNGALGGTLGLFRGPDKIPTGDTRRKDAKVFLPNSYSEDKEWPVVVMLHGYTGTADMENAYLGLKWKVSKQNFILVTPEGYTDSKGNQFWNATNACCDFDKSQVDDVGYINRLMKQIQEKYRVDSRKIYIIGHSNGGFMAHRLACTENSIFSGIVSLAGSSVENPEECKSTRPVSVLQIHAEDDPTILYGGNRDYPSALDNMRQWARRNGCESIPTVGPDQDLILSLPGNDTSAWSWKNCNNRAKVELWTIRAGGTNKLPVHKPHIPLLGLDFTDKALDFLMR